MSAQRLAVWNGEKEKTSGGLRKADLTKNRHGRIVSKRKSEVARKLNNLGNFLAGKGKKQEAKPEPIKKPKAKPKAKPKPKPKPAKAPAKPESLLEKITADKESGGKTRRPRGSTQTWT